MLTQREYHIIIGKLVSGTNPTQQEINSFLRVVAELEGMLDEGDHEDYYGTEGWRHRLGWD